MSANFGSPFAMELLSAFFPTSPVLANVSSKATELFHGSSILEFLTNSVLVALLVLGIVLWFSRKATKNMTLIPHKAQNFFEFIIEFLYGQLVGIIGEKQAKLAFPLIGHSLSTFSFPTGLV
jgi:F-type H+-transporting ATPase subunit a